MRNYSRFIPEEEVGNVEQWNFAAVDAASQILAAQRKAREASAEQAHDETLRQQGYAQGYTQGHAQATLEGQRQIDAYIAQQGHEAALQFGRLFAAAQQQLEQAQQRVAQELLELACELARQVLRQELSVNPNVLMPVIREALGLLVGDNKEMLVKLHPQDKDVLQDTLQAEFPGLGLTLMAEPALRRGDCLVEAGGAVVDATLGKRWSRAIATLGLEYTWAEVGDGH